MSSDSDSDNEEKNKTLENKLIFIPNPDKVNLDVSYVEGDSNMRVSMPFRLIIAGNVGCGKTLMSINIILQRQLKEPRFEQIHIIHGLESSREYDSIEPTSIRTNIPHISDFTSDRRILLVFDDVEFSKLKRQDLRNLVTICRVGSHCGISMIFVNQIFCAIPKAIRDNSNLFVVFKPTDLDSINTLGRRIGIDKKTIKHVFDKICPSWHDSLCVNLTKGAKFKYSRNLFGKIDIDNK